MSEIEDTWDIETFKKKYDEAVDTIISLRWDSDRDAETIAALKKEIDAAFHRGFERGLAEGAPGNG